MTSDTRRQIESRRGERSGLLDLEKERSLVITPYKGDDVNGRARNLLTIRSMQKAHGRTSIVSHVNDKAVSLRFLFLHFLVSFHSIKLR
jgi:hypothetical protein